MTRTDLIAKLEAASVGSRELDAEIYAETHEPMFGRYRSPNKSDDPGNPYMAQKVTAPNYTTSIDAIVGLIEKMLPSWSIQIMIERRSKELPWFCVHMQDSEYISLYWHEGDADGNAYSQAYSRATPSIALCIALLRALEAKEAAEKSAMDDMLEQDGKIL